VAEVQTYDTFEDMLAHIDQQVEAAKANTLPRQNEITYGDYWMGEWQGILIFGKIMTLAELEAGYDQYDSSPEEIQHEREATESAYNDGFRFGTAYSQVVPEGELGDTHVSTMVPITADEFESAQKLFWSPDTISREPWFADAIGRIMA
jgi:hypothetical protein